MKSTLFAVLFLGVAFALVANGFLFPTKFKNGCDPNPCKHKSTCKLDAKNSSLSTCACPEGYHGKHCELKTGCYSKPCKKGNCTNNKINPSNYTCTCQAGIVGKNCDTADACLKNPCKGGRCDLDAKLKPVCSCNYGWGSKNCDKRNCTIVQFKGKQLAKQSIKVFHDKSIEKNMNDLDGLAKLCGVKLYVLKGFVLHPDSKAIQIDTKDKLNPNHYVGQAISFHIYDLEDKLACNDVCLGKIPIPHKGAKCFVDGLHAITWKWSILDPTTTHTGFHVANTLNYNKLREHHQVGCRDTKFI